MSHTADESKICSCGICLKSDAEKICTNCDIQFCLPCLLVHEKLPLTKSHRIINITSSSIRYTNSLTGYCKSHKTLIYLDATDDALNHNSCTVINISEYKQKLEKNLFELITEAGESMAVIEKDLKFVDEEKLAVVEDANLLKRKIKYQSEILESYLQKHIDECSYELNEQVDEECDRFEMNLNSLKNKLLKSKTILEGRRERCKTFLEDLSQKTVVMQAFESDLASMFKVNKNTKLTEELLKNSFNERIKLSFEPTVENNLFRDANFLGTMNRARKPYPEVIRVIKSLSFDASTSLSTDGRRLYGFDSKISHVDQKSSISIMRLCSKTYNQLSAVVIDVNYQFLPESILVGRFLCILGYYHLLIIDPDIPKSKPDRVKNIRMKYSSGKLLHSSEMSIFIIYGTTVKELSLSGEKICEIKLPQNFNTPLSIAKLNHDRYAVTSSQNDIQIINSNEGVFKTLNLNDSMSSEQFRGECRMTTDNNCNLFISDRYCKFIVVLDYNLNILQQFNTQCFPIQMCYDHRRDRLLVFGENQLNVIQL